MLSALVVAVLAVALGAALTAVSGARPVVLGLLRTFAAMAAAAVVASHLLPEALSSVGLWGGAAFLVGLLAPHSLHLATEKLALRKSGLSPARVALEAGFIGLLVHHVGDGLGIGAYAALPGGVLAHLDVIVALIAHTVPLVAVVTLAYRGEYGLPVALRRAAALAVASALGVVISFAVPSAALTSAAGWVGALVGGVLMHIVTHDWLEDLPKTEPARLADLIAAGLGLSLVSIGGHEPGHGTGASELLGAARAVAERGAPFLLVALALSFSLGDRVKRALENLGQSLPLLLARRLGFALGAEGLALGLSTYGVAWTLGATLATTVVPLVAGAVALLAITLAGEDEPKRASERLAQLPEPSGDRFRRFDRATALWLVSVALFAVFSASLPGSALYDTLAGPGELVTSALVGALVGSGGPAVVAVSSLTEKGLSPGAALVAVTLSSALGFKALLGLGRALGARGLIPVVVWLACLTGAIGLGLNQVTPIPSPIAFPEVVGKVALVALLALVLVRAQRVGVRRWLAGWLGSSGHQHHGAHEGHSHHSSESPNGSAATTRSPEASGPNAEA